MTEMPSVLGLAPDEAVRRLEALGFSGVSVLESGRRREGMRRVIRQKTDGETAELIVSHFKNLDWKTEDNV